MAVVDPQRLGNRVIEGVFGQVDGSIIPSMTGFETGMSAFGDLYAWLRRVLMFAVDEIVCRSEALDDTAKIQLAEECRERMLARLGDEASKIRLDIDSPFATDWINGRRTPSPKDNMWCGIMGLRLGSGAADIYLALVEATAFATKAIVDHLSANGIEADEFVAIGGISRKSPLAMQMLSDVLGRRVDVAGCRESCVDIGFCRRRVLRLGAEGAARSLPARRAQLRAADVDARYLDAALCTLPRGRRFYGEYSKYL